MQFNSFNFIFAFLPAVVLVYYAISFSRLAPLRRPFLILATLAFYAIGGARFLPILLSSVAFNWVAGLAIERMRGSPGRERLAVSAGVIGNLLLLGYFKYFAFLATSFDAAFGTTFDVGRILLPLGISFFTFIEIGYLIDVGRGRMKAAGLLDFTSFVLFFPQLLAGPLVQYKETAPQLAQSPVRALVWRNILIGLMIFAIGMFKKTVVADTAALYAGPAFEGALHGGPIGWLDTWIGAFSYTLQIYFDFSGYSDMAIGTARMLGILLPLNFHSPLNATSIVEIWRRWHMTLGRWVQNYIFQPMAMPLARVAGRYDMDTYGTLLFAVVIPTLTSMVVLGIWHGSGWTFAVFGLMQGIYMATNELFATIRKDARKARRKAKIADPAWKAPLSRAATVIAFSLTMIPFNSPDLASTTHMWAAMAGLSSALVTPEAWPFGLGGALVTLAIILAASYTFPNTQQIMGRFEPVLEWERWRKVDPPRRPIEWRMTLGWTVLGAFVFFMGAAFIMRGTTKFIYFNF